MSLSCSYVCMHAPEIILPSKNFHLGKDLTYAVGGASWWAPTSRILSERNEQIK